MATPRKAGAKRGRPAGYREQFAGQAYKLCLLGATDREIADFFAVDPSTIYRWQNRVPEFCESIARGKLIADATVAESLFKRANGYSHRAIKFFWQPGYVEGEGEAARFVEGRVKRVSYLKHYPPDTTALSFWLRNRQPDKWRNVVEIEHSRSTRPLSKRSTEELLELLDDYTRASGRDVAAGAAAEKPPGKPDTVH